MSALPQAPAQAGVAAILAALGGGRAGEPGAGFDRLFAGLPAEQPINAAPVLPNSAELPLDIAAAPVQASDAPAPQVPALAEPAADAAPGGQQPACGATAAAALLAVLDNGFAAASPAAIPSGTTGGAKLAQAIDAPKGGAEDEGAPAEPDAALDMAPLLPAIASPEARPAASAATGAASPITADGKGAQPIAPDSGASMAVIFTQPATHSPGVVAPASAEPVAERTLDLASDDAWIAQLASDIAATKSESGDISFRLMPRHLGRLDVAMTSDDAGVSVKLDTQHEATATVVHAAQGKLVDELRQQGVRVVGAEVTCTPGETGRHSQGQGRAPAHDPAHLIETAAERVEARSEPHREDRAAAHRGRFA
ncbi:flagellar hook-length control protein FliK [Sphingopyxis flava]|uniref:Flagellar hook-length control protein FliK n=1 Tax=Sphingopyxis flava TaxID=1507287 RepID=A0A1T5B2V7_9SPHN|nr:flagellar hook-length control protein FliK [Sphingopyxis flava]SKB41641.1 flagellar hook-length control protein FliK [Sphingopyxis flava]